MAGFNVASGNLDHLIRSEVWSSQLKEALQDELMATKYVKWLDEFPGGSTTLTIPSIGDAVLRNYAEDTAVVYDAMDTGEFQFTISEYLSSATYITNKAKQDVFYMNELVSSFVPKMNRAIMEHVEASIFGLQGQQTAANANTINGAAHRVSGSHASIAGQLGLSDFAYAKFALRKANVPQSNLIAIVDPSVEYLIENTSNLVSVSNNPRWEGIIESGMTTGMTFLRNIYGFDVYVSQHLSDITSETLDELDGSTSNAITNGKASIFFSAAPDVLPFVGAWAQQPVVDSEYNKDHQREEYVTTARYGVKLYRPENLFTVVHSTALA